MEDNITVSVIIPIYNAEKFLNECLDKVFKQTLKNIEVICVDDGSTDSSRAILEQYKNEGIRIFSQTNSGAGVARNVGLRAAKGKYVNFVDPDDFYSSDIVLERLYDAAVDNDALVCGGNIQRLGTDGKIEEDIDKFTEEGFVYFRDFQKCRHHVKYIIKREFLFDNGIEYPEYRRYQDPPFLARVMNCAEKIYAITDVVYTYRNNFSVKKYTKNNVKETMRGLIDLLKYSSENSLDLLHANMIYEVNELYSKYIYRYWLFDTDDEFNDLVDQINKSINPYFLSNIYLGKNDAFRLANDAKEYIENLSKLLIETPDIIVYGAGIVGKKVNALLSKIGVTPIGVAVTVEKECYPNAKRIEKYIDYKDEALVIVATRNGFRKEICNHLIDLGFKRILLIDQEKINYYFLTEDVS